MTSTTTKEHDSQLCEQHSTNVNTTTSKVRSILHTPTSSSSSNNMDTNEVTVNFGSTTVGKSEEYHEKKKRYLTAKYDQQTRRLIQKRLNVENFIYDQLRMLFQLPDEQSDPDVDIDLDELLQLANENDQVLFLQEKLKVATSSNESKQKFITSLLEMLKSL